jgi:hypothetical protein
MSANVRFGSQAERFAPQNVMSALPPIADMCGATRDVRFGSLADIDQPKQNVRQGGHKQTFAR